MGGSPGTTDSELLVENGLTLSCIFLRVLGGGFLFVLCCVLVNVPSETCGQILLTSDRETRVLDGDLLHPCPVTEKSFQVAYLRLFILCRGWGSCT